MTDILILKYVLFLYHIILYQFYTKTHWVWDPCITTPRGISRSSKICSAATLEITFKTPWLVPPACIYAFLPAKATNSL